MERNKVILLNKTGKKLSPVLQAMINFLKEKIHFLVKEIDSFNFSYNKIIKEEVMYLFIPKEEEENEKMAIKNFAEHGVIVIIYKEVGNNDLILKHHAGKELIYEELLRPRGVGDPDYMPDPCEYGLKVEDFSDPKSLGEAAVISMLNQACLEENRIINNSAVAS